MDEREQAAADYVADLAAELQEISETHGWVALAASLAAAAAEATRIAAALAEAPECRLQ